MSDLYLGAPPAGSGELPRGGALASLGGFIGQASGEWLGCSAESAFQRPELSTLTITPMFVPTADGQGTGVSSAGFAANSTKRIRMFTTHRGQRFTAGSG